MKKLSIVVTVLLSFVLVNCSAESDRIKYNSPQVPVATIGQQLQYLALGDSYTIGESVCQTCSFPEQLKQQLASTTKHKDLVVDIIARTGWTTTNLNTAIQSNKPNNTYDFVSLLIGVNNQFQQIDFAVYEKEFPLLVQQSITFAKGNKKSVIVLSIPDYAYTPYGQRYNDPSKISNELDRYNAFAKTYCEKQGIAFINITDITRQGLQNPKLVSADGLHPSSLAYAQIVERLYPQVINVLETN